MIKIVSLNVLIAGVLVLVTLAGKNSSTVNLIHENSSGSDRYSNSAKQSGQSTGIQLYSKYCLTCHQADGKGVRGTFPPLAGNAKVTGPSAEIIKVVLFGLKGPVTVNGRDYNSVMPPQKYLSDQQIADILNYIRNNWENKAPPIKPDEVGKLRKAGNSKTN
jgi:nitrite reductase (NO-forming)